MTDSDNHMDASAEGYLDRQRSLQRQIDKLSGLHETDVDFQNQFGEDLREHEEWHDLNRQRQAAYETRLSKMEQRRDSQSAELTQVHDQQLRLQQQPSMPSGAADKRLEALTNDNKNVWSALEQGMRERTALREDLEATNAKASTMETQGRFSQLDRWEYGTRHEALELKIFQAIDEIECLREQLEACRADIRRERRSPQLPPQVHLHNHVTNNVTNNTTPLQYQHNSFSTTSRNHSANVGEVRSPMSATADVYRKPSYQTRSTEAQQPQHRQARMSGLHHHRSPAGAQPQDVLPSCPQHHAELDGRPCGQSHMLPLPARMPLDPAVSGSQAKSSVGLLNKSPTMSSQRFEIEDTSYHHLPLSRNISLAKDRRPDQRDAMFHGRGPDYQPRAFGNSCHEYHYIQDQARVAPHEQWLSKSSAHNSRQAQYERFSASREARSSTSRTNGDISELTRYCFNAGRQRETQRSLLKQRQGA